MGQYDNSVSDNIPNFETFGNYVLLKRLATGGMAEVFLARPATHKGNGRVQVIKRILPHVATDELFLKMFQTEIRVCMGFNHPHTVQLHDFGEANRQPYISMEYIEGKNLKDVICKFGEKSELMPIPMVLSLLAQAASGLGYAHTFVNKVTGEEVRAIHRDISPHNLILSYDGNLKVIDFGIAKAASSMQEATRAGTIKGKYAYLSPEQVNAQIVDARSDIFALGIVAWELLTLRRPFYRDGDSEMTILGTIANCDHHVKPPSFYNCEIPKEVDEIVLKALRKDPNERFSSAVEFQGALRQVMQQYYPKYSYAETGKLMQSLFEEEILKERKEIRDLNMQVQLSLSNGDATVVDSGKPGVVATVLQGFKSAVPGVDVDTRLKEIEFMMKKKASMKHYLLFGFYIISLVILKLDNTYPIFDFLLPKDEVADVVDPGAEEQIAPKPARSNRHRRTSKVVKKAPEKAAARTPALATQDEAD
jgi:serine/threonine protein kinase